ncbi:MAG: hypothetical protein KAX18_14430, partial [Candidatus Lokiarchaeota archaeon]|nr:hypothetical protein [Candidatus Lokiarchaeota archaeon]
KVKKLVTDKSLVVLNKRISRSNTPKNKQDLLDGERYEIATQLAKEIGKLLDKALYSKFKKK